MTKKLKDCTDIVTAKSTWDKMLGDQGEKNCIPARTLAFSLPNFIETISEKEVSNIFN